MRLSGPAERESPLFLKACEIISGEKPDAELSNGHSFSSRRLTIRANGSLKWGTGEVNCLAKAVAISSLWMSNLEDKLMD